VRIALPPGFIAISLTHSQPVGAAVDWLSNNADKSIEELKEDEGEEESPLSLQPGEQARSLLCKDCGKKFRSTAQAEFHANKTYVTSLPSLQQPC
jgi:hypothetical protein